MQCFHFKKITDDLQANKAEMVDLYTSYVSTALFGWMKFHEISAHSSTLSVKASRSSEKFSLTVFCVSRYKFIAVCM